MMNTAKKINRNPIVDASFYAAITDAIRAEAQRLLAGGTVGAVIGYAPGRRAGTAVPTIASTPEQARELFFSPACVNNLALYLSRAKKDLRRRGRLAVVAKGCDLKALAVLIGESQLRREDVVVIGVACPGVGKENLCAGELEGPMQAEKCRLCRARLPQGADFVAESPEALPELPEGEKDEDLSKLEAMTPAERWNFWKEHFSRCIRCYACRQVCPLCYCEQCLCDRNRPQAVEITPRPAGNTAWHIVRAMHLAGRCVGCAECERVCPMDIPFNLLNRKMSRELKELYEQEQGFEPVEKGPLAQYREDDDQSFIK
jgi:formate dehydrogenase subunit beta